MLYWFKNANTNAKSAASWTTSSRRAYIHSRPRRHHLRRAHRNGTAPRSTHTQVLNLLASLLQKYNYNLLALMVQTYIYEELPQRHAQHPLAYWYKRTNTHLTCFAGTKVQILLFIPQRHALNTHPATYPPPRTPPRGGGRHFKWTMLAGLV